MSGEKISSVLSNNMRDCLGHRPPSPPQPLLWPIIYSATMPHALCSTHNKTSDFFAIVVLLLRRGLSRMPVGSGLHTAQSGHF